MELLDDILNSTLHKYYKRYIAGEYLFRQGDLASIMYFLVNGRLQLIAERPEGSVVEGVLETGQFLGEKVLLQPDPYKRVFSAFCETDLLVLELTNQDVVDIEAHAPSVMTDLMKTVLQVVGDRFEQTNFVARALRSDNPVVRIANIVRHFSRSAINGLNGDNRFPLTEESILKYVDTDRKIIRATLKALIDEGILARQERLFLVTDDEALVAFAEAQ